MDDKQLALLLTAMSDQASAMNRMADAVGGILVHLNPKAAAKMAAPGYLRPLAAYASFDWTSIDAHVIAFDRHGATEVEHNGVAYRRYRSNDDDPKGVDIRFRRVVAGTVEGKDMVWATLVKFADKKAKDAPRPLRGELAEKIEHAAEQASHRAPIAVPIAPTTPAPVPVAAAAVEPEPAPATPNSSLTTNDSSLTTNDSSPTAPDPWQSWQAARDTYGEGPIPSNIMPAHGDDISMLARKTAALNVFAAWLPDSQALYAAAVAAHDAAVSEAVRLKMTTHGAFMTLSPMQEPIEIDAKTSTLKNLIGVERRKISKGGAVASVDTGASAGTQPSLARGAEQVKAELVSVASKSAGMRQMDEIMRTRVYLALKAACAGDVGLHGFILYVFGHASWKSVTSAEAWALNGWLKPAQGAERQWVASNAKAADEAANVLKVERVPA